MPRRYPHHHTDYLSKHGVQRVDSFHTLSISGVENIRNVNIFYLSKKKIKYCDPNFYSVGTAEGKKACSTTVPQHSSVILNESYCKPVRYHTAVRSFYDKYVRRYRTIVEYPC